MSKKLEELYEQLFGEPFPRDLVPPPLPETFVDSQDDISVIQEDEDKQ